MNWKDNGLPSKNTNRQWKGIWKLLSTAEMIHPGISILRCNDLKGCNLVITFYLLLFICCSVMVHDYMLLLRWL